MKTTRIRYEVEVTGRIWQGCKGSTVYSFDHLPTHREVISKAGDFEHVHEVACIKVTTTTEIEERGK